MARQQSILSRFNFTGGIDTESGPLTFAQNTMSDCENIDVNIDGSIQRRKGLEVSSYRVPIGSSAKATYYIWKNAETVSGDDYLIVKLGQSVIAYNMNSGLPLGSSIIWSITIAAHNTTGLSDGPATITSVRQHLIIASSDHDITVIDNSGSLYKPTPEIRDLENISQITDQWPSNTVDKEDRRRPLVGIPSDTNWLNTQYTLQNRGWTVSMKGDVSTVANTKYGILGAGLYWLPNEGMQWGVGASTSLTGGGGDTAFNANAMIATDWGNTIAPLGAEKMHPWVGVRTIKDGAVGFFAKEPEQTTARPSSVAPFAGRVFYAGVDSPAYRENIYFSKILNLGEMTVTDEVGPVTTFFQENDPTSSDYNTPLDTDGGIIVIPGVGLVSKLEVLGQALLIFSNNGVWSVQGGDGLGFRPTDFSVTKVSDEEILQAVVNGSNVFGVSVNGLIAFEADKISGKIQWISLAESTFKKGWREWMAEEFALAGGYQRVDIGIDSERQVVIVSGTNTNKVLYDLRLKAFSKYVGAVSTNIVTTQGPFPRQEADGTFTPTYLYTEVVGGFTYLSFASYTGTDLLDYIAPNTYQSYPSFIETGYDLGNSPIADMSAIFIYSFLNRTETGFIDNGAGEVKFDYPSSCILTAKWDWTGTTGRWSEPQQVYRFNIPFIPGQIGDPFDYSYNVIETRSKIRGKGTALQLRFESEEGKDFQLLGWAIPIIEETTI